MPAELDIDGVYVPSLLLLAVFAFLVTAVLRALLARTGFYALVWHRALFDFATFLIVLGGTVYLLRDLV
jgi:hypothetical protein